MKGGCVLPGENEREWEMQDREVKRAKERVFFQEKLPLQLGPTEKITSQMPCFHILSPVPLSH